MFCIWPWRLHGSGLRWRLGGLDGESASFPAPVLDNACVMTAASEASSSAGLSIPAVDCLVIAVSEASSSASSMVSPVGESCMIKEASDASSGLTISAGIDTG